MDISDIDAATLAHIRGNIDAYRQQHNDLDPQSFVWAETWNGILLGNVGSLLGIIERLTRPEISVPCAASWMNGDGEIMTCELTSGHDSLHKRGQNFTSHALNDSDGGYAGKHEAGA